MGARGGTTHTAIDTQSTSGSLLSMYGAASCGPTWRPSGYTMRHTSVPLKSQGVACEAVVCRWNRYGRRRTTLILESDDELELGAPKRYEKLYLVTMSKSKSGSWQTAKVRSCRRRTWRSCEGCRTSLESCEDEKAKTRRSPWRVGAHERLKSNYDCDLVVDVLEDSISLQEVLTRAKLNG